MKLLGISLTAHDHSVAYYDGIKVRFHKFERTKEIKRYRFHSFSKFDEEIRNLWNVSISDMDDVASCFSCLFNNSFKPNIIPHHYAHALSVYPLIGRKPDLSIVVDGFGDGKTWSVFKDDKWINYGTLKEGSIGNGIRDSGILLGIKYQVLQDIAGKVMALQTYGHVDEDYLAILRKHDMNNLNYLFSFENWKTFKGSDFLSELTKLNWLTTIHTRIEELLLELFHKFASPNDIIGYSGGVAQNVVWNTTLKKHFKNLYIPPHSCDEGLSLGCLEWLRQKHNLPVFDMTGFPYIQNDVAPSDEATDETIRTVAKFLSEGKTVGWYQGHGEVGPRALGNRSILMDPRISDGKEIINRIKNRESYRPFGASILKEHANEYFDMVCEDEYMLYTCRVKINTLPAITHIDESCRVQTVDEKNPIFRKLLTEFNNITGCPLLLNTSLNLAGKPIAGNPQNAIDLLKNTSLDCAVIGDDIHFDQKELSYDFTK